MIGRILNYRRSRHRTYPRQYIAVAEGIYNKDDAAKLVGKKVVWSSSGKHIKTILGVITAVHGNKGEIRVAMKHGLPGQAIGNEIEIK